MRLGRCYYYGVIFLLFSSSFSLNYGFANESNDFLSGSWFKNIDDIPVLFVTGSSYEMGYQHAYHLKEKALENLRAFLNVSDSKYSRLLNEWNEMKKYVPNVYLDELKGMADGLNVNLDEIGAAYMVIGGGEMNCFGLSCWGNSTIDKKLYQSRSFDLPMDISDPINGTYVHENYVLIIRNPDNGFSSICPSVAGSLHGGGGFNEKGISIGMQVCGSNDETLFGIPAIFRLLQALDYSETALDAIDYLINNKTQGWTFIVSDAKVPIGYAVEVSGFQYYVGVCDDGVESIDPFWEINDIVRRTNFFIDPVLSGTQRLVYDPSGLKGFLRIFTDDDVYFVIWYSYVVMSKEFEKEYGYLDLNTSMRLFHDGYSGNTNVLLKLIIRLAEGTSFNRAWHIWVVCPETGDFVISFAERDKKAFETSIHYFNLHSLINL